MRAKFVLENINFERGSSVFKQLRIGKAGYIHEIEELMKDFGGVGLKYGSKVFWHTALNWMTIYNKKDLVKFVLDNGKNFTLTDLNSALIYAEENNNKELIELLKSFGATKGIYSPDSDRTKNAIWLKRDGKWLNKNYK